MKNIKFLGVELDPITHFSKGDMYGDQNEVYEVTRIGSLSSINNICIHEVNDGCTWIAPLYM